MTRYTKVKVRISEGQKDKPKKAFEYNSKSITIRDIIKWFKEKIPYENS